MFVNNKQDGFTLIELLLTMAILGMLASVITFIINPQQLFAQTRDSKRLQAVSQIVNAAESFATRHNGLFPPGYSGDGPYGDDCTGGIFMYPDYEMDTQNCVTNSLIAEGELKVIPKVDIQNQNAPIQCANYFYYHVVPSVDWFGQLGAVSDNEHYMLQFCLESWSASDAIRYQNNYNDGAYEYNDYPICFYDSSRNITSCYLYDWQKIPPLKP